MAALGSQVLASTTGQRNNATAGSSRVVVGFAAFDSSRADVLLSKKRGQSDREFKHACDKRDGLVTKRAGKIVCVAQTHMGSMRGSYGGGRAKSLPDETMPPQAQQPHP